MLKELFSYMKQYKKYAWISLACIAVECIFELVIPLIMADMVDVGIANGDQDYILHKGLVMIGCAGLALVLGICSARFCALCGQGFGKQSTASCRAIPFPISTIFRCHRW